MFHLLQKMQTLTAHGFRNKGFTLHNKLFIVKARLYSIQEQAKQETIVHMYL